MNKQTNSDAAHNFSFEQVGKRMPYTTPDGFLDDLEANVLATVATDARVAPIATTHTTVKRRSYLKVVWLSALSAAAVITLFLVMHTGFTASADAPSWQTVDEAFAQLSVEDQAFLIDVYQDDVFLNGEIE